MPGLFALLLYAPSCPLPPPSKAWTAVWGLHMLQDTGWAIYTLCIADAGTEHSGAGTLRSDTY